MGDGDGAKEAQCQPIWENNGDNGVTTPAQAVPGAASRGGGEMVIGRHRGDAESTRSAVSPTTMVVSAAPFRGGGRPSGKPWGGSFPMVFLGLMDSTQLAGLAPDPQGVSGPTNGENQGGRFDSTTIRNLVG